MMLHGQNQTKSNRQARRMPLQASSCTNMKSHVFLGQDPDGTAKGTAQILSQLVIDCHRVPYNNL